SAGHQTPKRMRMARGRRRAALHPAPVRVPPKGAERAAVAVEIPAYTEELDQAGHPDRNISGLRIGPIGEAVAGIDEPEHALKAMLAQHLQTVAARRELHALAAEL